MKTLKLLSRLKAGGFHMLISIAVVGLALTAIIYLWYPLEIIGGIGAAKIILLICVVDIGIGPLLTTLVYDEKKPELKRDLGTIVLIQFAALAYGLWTVAIARPSYYVFSVDRFELVQAQALKPYDGTKELAFGNHFGKPKWVGAKLPDSEDEANRILFSSIDKGYDLAQMPEYYINYSLVKDEVAQRALPTQNLRKLNNSDENSPKLNEIIKEFGDEELFGYLPMTSSKLDLTVIVDKKSGQPVKIVDLKPW